MFGERMVPLIKELDVKSIAIKLELNDVLTFRPIGKMAKSLVLEEVQKLKPGDTLEMNFKEIRSCDVSFVDEMIIEIQLSIKQHNNLLSLSNINSEIEDNLEAALALREQKNKERIQILIKDQTGYRYIGNLEQNLQDTFSLFTNKK